MGLFDSIWSAGEQLLGGSDSSLDGIIGSVIGSVGDDGFGAIVNQVTGSTDGFWGAVNTVVENELGSEYADLVTGIKDVAAGDNSAIFGTVIGGVRDYVGEDRFDGIANTIGQAVNGQTDGWMDELTGHITTAVGDDGFTAVMGGVTELIGDEPVTGFVNGILGEVKVAVGEDTWEILETASGYAGGVIDTESGEAVDADAGPGDEILEPFAEGAGIADGLDLDLDADDDDETLNPFEDDVIRPDSPFGDMPLEDILESSITPGEGPVDSPFGDMPLEDILEPSVDSVGDVSVLTGPPVAAPVALTAAVSMPHETVEAFQPPAVEEPVMEEAPVEFEPVASLQVAAEANDNFSETVDDFFDGVG